MSWQSTSLENTAFHNLATSKAITTVVWCHEEKRIFLQNKSKEKSQDFSDARSAAAWLGFQTSGYTTTDIRTMFGIPPKGGAQASVKQENKLVQLPVSVAKVATPNNTQKLREELVLWVWEVRNKIKKAQEAGNRTKRQASTRMIQAGIKLLDVGLKLDQVKARLLVGWSNDEINKFAPSVSSVTPKFGGIVDEGTLLIRAGFTNIFFVGPPGCGKTTLAGKIAERLKVPFASIPCSDQLPTSSLYGKTLADGTYVTTSFVRIYEGGGVFLFDEIFKLLTSIQYFKISQGF